MRVPQQGSLGRRIYDVIAEFPGVKVSTAEIAAECNLDSHKAAANAHSLFVRGYVKKEVSDGRNAAFWVES